MKKPITFVVTTVALLALLTGAQAEEKDMEVLRTELPRPMFVGTPVPVKLPHLEKPLGRKRPDFMVPKGTTNVALEKEVTGSDDFPVIGELEFVTDGDKEGAEGSYVELGPALQHVQIDLEDSYSIYAILVWHYHAQARAYHDVIVQVSDDPDFSEGVTTVYQNDHDNSSGLGIGKDKAYIETSEGRLIDTKGAKGRYVRLYSRGNTANEMNHYVEVEVFGGKEG
jgi:hypothetical protein